jgi:hypothetical protein
MVPNSPPNALPFQRSSYTLTLPHTQSTSLSFSAFLFNGPSFFHWPPTLFTHWFILILSWPMVASFFHWPPTLFTHWFILILSWPMVGRST